MNIITVILEKRNGFGKLHISLSFRIACAKVGTLHEEITISKYFSEILFDETGGYLGPRIHSYILTVRVDTQKSG